MMELKDTIQLMNSSDYKERFLAEYNQTKIRYDKLKDLVNKIEAASMTLYAVKKIDMPHHDCPADLLKSQLKCMAEYLHVLEIRAIIEGIEL